jgi:hypothetical protein
LEITFYFIKGSGGFAGDDVGCTVIDKLLSSRRSSLTSLMTFEELTVSCKSSIETGFVRLVVILSAFMFAFKEAVFG